MYLLTITFECEIKISNSNCLELRYFETYFKKISSRYLFKKIERKKREKKTSF